jgi:hypothetical protein
MKAIHGGKAKNDKCQTLISGRSGKWLTTGAVSRVKAAQRRREALRRDNAPAESRRGVPAER